MKETLLISASALAFLCGMLTVHWMRAVAYTCMNLGEHCRDKSPIVHWVDNHDPSEPSFSGLFLLLIFAVIFNGIPILMIACLFTVIRFALAL